MADRLAEIRAAIDRFQMDEARELASQELEMRPSAEAYYLASLAALNHGQRIRYLERALELEPEHRAAQAELADIRRLDEDGNTVEPLTAERAEQAEEPKVKLASISKRFIAICVDGFIVAFFSLAFMAASGQFASLYDAMATLDETIVAEAVARFQSEAIPVNLVVSAAYNVVLMTAFNGQTLGKMIFGMRVVKKRGGRITVLDAVVRNVFGYTVSQILLLGYLWAVIDDEAQAWHDKMAGTVVVEERRTVTR